MLTLNWKEDLLNKAITNSKDTEVLYYAEEFLLEEESKGYLVVEFSGEILEYAGGCMYVNDYAIPLNSTVSLPINPPISLKFKIKVPARSALRIDKITVDFQTQERALVEECDHDKDVLVVTPDYPSTDNLYLCAFAHSRVREYVRNGLKVQVAAIGNRWYEYNYDFEGVPVYNGGYHGLKSLLSRKQYKVIITHFVDLPLMQIYDGYTTSEKLIFICHGAETYFRHLYNLCRPYFSAAKPHEDVSVEFDQREQYIQKYAQKENAEWVFVSRWLMEHAEESNHCVFRNKRVINNLIDENRFPYHAKTADDRKKIIILRKFDNISVHAIDQSVFAILELSRRPFFQDLTFEVYGDGSYWKELVAPIQHFPNVHIHKTFVPNKDMHLIYEQGGILLIPSRHDAHPVAMSEGAASGLVVVAAKVTSVPDFMNQEKNHTLADPENFTQLADIIERLYNNPEEYLEISKRMATETHERCSSAQTVMKEIALIQEKLNEYKPVFPVCKKSSDQPILSIVVPSYNVENYLEKCLYSLCNHQNAGETEILVVNDGSTDHTSEIAHRIADQMNGVVKVIDKENGGHGSTINVGIRNATGKYFRLIDGDDWVDSENLAKQIDILRNENADIVLTKGCYEYTDKPTLENIIDYPMLREGIHYHFDDLLYPNYGFQTYGPLLTTGTYRTECLKRANIHITEKKPYVDMEFNAYAQYYTDTVVFYDLDIYRYLIGRAGQTISRDFWKKKYNDHRYIILNILRTLDTLEGYSEWRKKQYVYKHLLSMMVDSQIFMFDQLCLWNEIDGFLSELGKYPSALETAKAYITEKNHESLFILEHYQEAINLNRKTPMICEDGTRQIPGQAGNETRPSLTENISLRKLIKAVMPYGAVRFYQILHNKD